MQTVIGISQPVDKSVDDKTVVDTVTVGSNHGRELDEILDKHYRCLDTVSTYYEVAILIIIIGP